jgi:hypothetical protein
MILLVNRVFSSFFYLLALSYRWFGVFCFHSNLFPQSPSSKPQYSIMSLPPTKYILVFLNLLLDADQCNLLFGSLFFFHLSDMAILSQRSIF